jgi:hypothetical protein
MKKLWKCFGIIVVALATVFAFVGCETDIDPTYTIWMDTIDNTDYVNDIEEFVDDGSVDKYPEELQSGEYFIVAGGSSDYYEIILQKLTNPNKNELTESELMDLLNARNVEEASWFVDYNHAVLIGRTGNTIEIILK